MSITKWESYEPEDEDDDVPPHSGPRQLPLPEWTMRGRRMTVAEVAKRLEVGSKRVTQLCEDFVKSHGRIGLPHMRADYGRQERLFFADDVEMYARWRMAREQHRRLYLVTWRG